MYHLNFEYRLSTTILQLVAAVIYLLASSASGGETYRFDWTRNGVGLQNYSVE